MAWTKRSLLVREVVAMMESGEYESADDLALAVVKKVDEAIGEKGGFVVVSRFGGVNMLHGPYDTQTQAERGMKLLPGGKSYTRPLLSVTSLKAMETTQSYDALNLCGGCKHPQVAHWNKGKCACRGCACSSWSSKVKA